MVIRAAQNATELAEFMPPPRASAAGKRMLVELGVAVCALGVTLLAGALASVLLRIAAVLLPVAVVAAVIAYAAFRIQAGASYGAQRAG
jgi:hypothetical protein